MQRYGSGSGSFYHQAKSKKNLDSYCFVTSFCLFVFENDVHVPSKSNKQKKFFFLHLGKVNDGNSRIRIRNRLHYSEAWIRGSRSGTGYTPKCHGSATLTIERTFFFTHGIILTSIPVFRFFCVQPALCTPIWTRLTRTVN